MGLSGEDEAGGQFLRVEGEVAFHADPAFEHAGAAGAAAGGARSSGGASKEVTTASAALGSMLRTHRR